MRTVVFTFSNRRKENKMDKYYIAVNDSISMCRVKWNEIQEYFGDINKPYIGPKIFESVKTRVFSEKFCKDPLMAAMDTVFESKRAYYKKDIKEKFLENLVFDPVNRVYVYNEFSTLGTMKEPKDWHYEKFFQNDFYLNFYHADIQILSTNVEYLADLYHVGGHPEYSRFMQK